MAPFANSEHEVVRDIWSKDLSSSFLIPDQKSCIGDILEGAIAWNLGRGKGVRVADVVYHSSLKNRRHKTRISIHADKFRTMILCTILNNRGNCASKGQSTEAQKSKHSRGNRGKERKVKHLQIYVVLSECVNRRAY